MSAILVYYLEVRDVGPGVVVGNAIFVNCIDDMTIVFFNFIFKTSARFCVREVEFFFRARPFVDYVLFYL